MSDEDKTNPGDATGGELPKGSKRKRLLLISLPVLLVAGGGAAYMFWPSSDPISAEMAAEAEKKLPYPFCREGPCLCDVCEKYGCSDPWKVCYPSNTCPVLGNDESSVISLILLKAKSLSVS